MEINMRKTLIALASATALVSASAPAHAGGEWVFPLVGGVILGGILADNHPHYNRYPRYDYMDDDGYAVEYRQPQVHVQCRSVPVYSYHGRYLGSERQCREWYD